MVKIKRTNNDIQNTTQTNKYLPNYYRAYPNHAKFEGLLSICNGELYKHQF